MERKWRPQKYFNCKDSLGWCSGIDTREIPYQSIQSERVEFHCATRSLDPQRTAAGGRSRNGGASTTATTSSRHRTIHLSTTCLASIICVECVHGHSHSAIARRAKQKEQHRGGGGEVHTNDIPQFRAPSSSGATNQISRLFPPGLGNGLGPVESETQRSRKVAPHLEFRAIFQTGAIPQSINTSLRFKWSCETLISFSRRFLQRRHRSTSRG